jgi:hypothetical protein
MKNLAFLFQLAMAIPAVLSFAVPGIPDEIKSQPGTTVIDLPNGGQLLKVSTPTGSDRNATSGYAQYVDAPQ